MKGKFILIEGGDGAGKDTQIERLRQLLDDAAVFTREPGGTRVGKVLRDMVLHNSAGPVALSAELFLFMADRVQHVEEVVKPALASGKHVISNRSWLSFIAYQIYGREQYDWKEFLEQGIQKIFADAPADLVVILDIPPEVGQQRQAAMGKAPDNMESLADAARKRIRSAFLDIAKTLPQAVIIDASKPLEEVWAEVKTAVEKVLQ